VAVDVTWRSRVDIAWPWLALVARLVLGGVWLAAGAAKIGDPEASVRAVRAYQLVPDPLERAVGYSLPLLEICLGVLLVIGLAQRLVGRSMIETIVESQWRPKRAVRGSVSQRTAIAQHRARGRGEETKALGLAALRCTRH